MCAYRGRYHTGYDAIAFCAHRQSPLEFETVQASDIPPEERLSCGEKKEKPAGCPLTREAYAEAWEKSWMYDLLPA